MRHKGQVPLHERFAPLRWLRRPFRAALFNLLKKASQTDEGKAMAVATLKGLLDTRQGLLDDAALLPAPPFEDLGKPVTCGGSATEGCAIFITGRFRSGSTLLWNLFRAVEGCTAYYEPLNERRFFDPALRGNRVDATHRNVSEYWREYAGLEELGRYYHEHWTSRNLLMDATFWEPDLQRYVEILMERAAGRPVLQFNRIDFRLPWFRRHFPSAKIVHLFRHPRDQWCSSLLDQKSFPAEAPAGDFPGHDVFYLHQWARDLKYHFLFLDETKEIHPYQTFYYIWKLSYLFGRKYAHYSLAFEHLVEDQDRQLSQLFDALAIRRYDLERLKQLIVKPALGKWKEYASQEWFERHEAACETVLADFLGSAPVPAPPK